MTFGYEQNGCPEEDGTPVLLSYPHTNKTYNTLSNGSVGKRNPFMKIGNQ
jgi:hypothetical protein